MLAQKAEVVPKIHNGEIEEIKEMLAVTEDEHNTAISAIVKWMMYENAYVARDKVFNEEVQRNRKAMKKARSKGFDFTMSMTDWRKKEYEDPETITFVAEQKLAEFKNAWNDTAEIIMNERKASADEAIKRKKEYWRKVHLVTKTLSVEPQTVQQIADKAQVSFEQFASILDILLNNNLANQCKDGRWTKHGNQ